MQKDIRIRLYSACSESGRDNPEILEVVYSKRPENSYNTNYPTNAPYAAPRS
jgi:hypothetical protein